MAIYDLRFTNMKKFKAAVQWVVINGLVGGLVYAVVFTPLKDNPGLVNLTKFLLWFWALLAWPIMLVALIVAIFANPGDKVKHKQDGRPVPAWIDYSFDGAVTLMCAYAGWPWLAAVYLLHVFAQHLTRMAVAAALKNQQPVTPPNPA